MATLFQTLGVIVYQGFTTARRDDLNARERMILWNTTTSQWEMFLSGVWRAVLILDANGNITAAQHGILTGDLHPEYARTAAPEIITTGWILASGGSIRPIPGDPPKGEVVIQVKVTTGAPTHSASLGTPCWVSPDATLYVNTNGSTIWTKQAADSSLHAQSHTLASHSTKPHSALSDAPSDAHHVAFVQADADALYILKALFDANTILAATSDDTPAALTIAASRILGRKSSGNIGALTGAEILAILSGQAAANFAMNSKKFTGLAAGSGAGDSVRYEQLHAQSHTLASHSTRPHSALSDAPADVHADTKVRTKEVDETSIGDGKVMVYRTASGKLEYETPASGGGTHPVNLATDVTGTLDKANIDADIARDSELHAEAHDHKVSKSYMFEFPDEDMAVGDFIPENAIRIPAANKHGDITWGTAYARCETVGTGTNTILFRTSTTLTGGRTTRATINLSTNREASAAITLAESDGMYLWVTCSAVGGTAPTKVTVQLDAEEAVF